MPPTQPRRQNEFIAEDVIGATQKHRAIMARLVVNYGIKCMEFATARCDGDPNYQHHGYHEMLMAWSDIERELDSLTGLARQYFSVQADANPSDEGPFVDLMGIK